MFNRKKKVYLEVNSAELRLLYRCLINWRNKLLTAGRITDPIDELLTKLMRRKSRLRIESESIEKIG